MASKRPAATGTIRHVAPTGDDTAAGDEKHPWKTITHGARKLVAGETLYVHAGVYFESVVVRAKGTAKAPITIRSAPGELAIVDGGLEEFQISPKTAWEKVAGDEYRSTKSFDTLGGSPRFITANILATMTPLHPYKFAVDLRASNVYWNLPKGTEAGTGIYVGPGLWFDPSTKRIHARLTPTPLANQDNYSGSTDPRSVPLVVGIDRSALTISGASHVRVFDLVLRGSATSTLRIDGASNLNLDGLTIYGGSPAVSIHGTQALKLVRSTVRGLASPWASRASMKYRGNSPYLFVAESTLPQSRDWEIAYNEFTDSHDGIVIDSLKNLRFHHNRIDNFNDDAIYLTLTPRESVPTNVQIYENHVTRTYTALAFGQREDGKKGGNAVGPGVFVFRNLFDLREGTYNRIPIDAAAVPGYRPLTGRMCGDHGGPVWEPLFIYQNTIVIETTPWRSYYGAQLVQGINTGTKRRLFNNIFAQPDGAVGTVFLGGDLIADGNLSWSSTSTATHPKYPAGSGANDVFADPKFVAFDPRSPIDIRLRKDSPAIDAGVPLPEGWPDSLGDRGPRDIGALPAGSGPFMAGPAAASSPSP